MDVVQLVKRAGGGSSGGEDQSHRFVDHPSIGHELGVMFAGIVVMLLSKSSSSNGILEESLIDMNRYGTLLDMVGDQPQEGTEARGQEDRRIEAEGHFERTVATVVEWRGREDRLEDGKDIIIPLGEG